MFILAELLGGCTVDELSVRMSVSERAEWRAYLEYKETERKKAEQRAKAKKGR